MLAYMDNKYPESATYQYPWLISSFIVIPLISIIGGTSFPLNIVFDGLSVSASVSITCLSCLVDASLKAGGAASTEDTRQSESIGARENRMMNPVTAQHAHDESCSSPAEDVQSSGVGRARMINRTKNGTVSY